jgi:DNA-binding GntR family transcriptional regulator
MSLPITRTVKSSLGDNLRDDILRGDLIPGQNIRLEEIALRFDVSTTPVREALRDLEAEGLVTIFPHRGAIVTQLSAKDLRDIYDIRATLEAMATRLAVPQMTEATLTKLLSYFEQMDSHLGETLSLIKLNHAFHLTLYGASNRLHLCELTGILRLRTQHYLVAFISDIGGMPQAQAEHQAIIEACTRGDADDAATLIYNHVNNVGSSLIDYVRRKEERNDS